MNVYGYALFSIANTHRSQIALSFLNAVKDVLEKYRDQFISAMDADAVIMDLKHADIISDGDENGSSNKSGATAKNKFLHEKLRNKCTTKAFMTFCNITIAVNGNPRMKELGEEMMKGKLLCI